MKERMRAKGDSVVDLDKLTYLVKKANLNNGFNLLSKPIKNNLATDIELPKIPTPEIAKPPELPKLKKIEPVKLDTGLGESKPKFTHDFKDNSPYNEK